MGKERSGTKKIKVKKVYLDSVFTLLVVYGLLNLGLFIHKNMDVLFKFLNNDPGHAQTKPQYGGL